MPVDGPGGPCNARTGDRCPQRFPGVHGCLHSGLDLVLLGDVGADENTVDLLGHGLTTFGVEVGDDDGRTGRSKFPGGGLTQATRTARDKGGDSVEIHVPNSTEKTDHILEQGSVSCGKAAPSGGFGELYPPLHPP